MKNDSHSHIASLTVPQAIIGGLAIFAVVIGMLFLEYSPELQPFRESIWHSLMWKTVITLLVLYFTWFPKRRPPLAGKLIESLVLLLLWGMKWIPSVKLRLLVLMLLLYGLLFYGFYLYLFKQEHYGVLNWTAVGLALFLFAQLSLYSYLSGFKGLPFWQIALVVALIVGIVFAVLLHKGFILLKDDRIGERICWTMIAFGVGFVLMVTTLTHLNYILDNSEPEPYSAVITEKELSGGGTKSVTSYVFVLETEHSTFKLEVTQSEYYAYEIGEEYQVQLHKGAFGEAFYVSD